jgi:hypothetical protein
VGVLRSGPAAPHVRVRLAGSWLPPVANQRDSGNLPRPPAKGVSRLRPGGLQQRRRGLPGRLSLHVLRGLFVAGDTRVADRADWATLVRRDTCWVLITGRGPGAAPRQPAQFIGAQMPGRLPQCEHAWTPRARRRPLRRPDGRPTGRDPGRRRRHLEQLCTHGVTDRLSRDRRSVASARPGRDGRDRY